VHRTGPAGPISFAVPTLSQNARAAGHRDKAQDAEATWILRTRPAKRVWWV
jgi:hypothetical protein